MLESQQNLQYDDPSKTFHGVRFILLGFDSDKEDEIRSKLLEGGGVDAVNYGPGCNYVIVDKLVYGDPVCIAARRDGKRLVTSLWVDHSSDVGMPVDHISVMYRPLKDLNGIPGAKSLVVCLTGYQRQDRDDIMTMVALMGANFSKPLVANKVTHLICYKFEGEKYELAKKMKRIQLVNHHWLEDCLKAWELLPEADYLKSGYEMEMEAEAKDSEEETEDVALAVEVGRKNVLSSQNTRVETKSFHQSPVMQEISRNSLYSSASKSLANVGETSKKNQSTPVKETDFQKASFSRETREQNLNMASARSPAKVSSEVPPDMHHSTAISEKVDNALLSASESSKKSPNADVSKSSSKSNIRSTPNKPTLSLRSERIEINLKGSPSSNVNKRGVSGCFDVPLKIHQDVTGFDGVKTPLKGTLSNLDEGQSLTLSYKRKMTVSRGSSKSLHHDPKPSTEGESVTKATTEQTKDPTHGSLVDGSRVLASDITPINLTRSFRKEASVSHKEALNISHAAEDRQEECDDQSLQRSPEGLENRTLFNVDMNELSSIRTDNCTSGAEMHQNDGQTVEPSSPKTNSVGRKRKMLAKKTSGSRPSSGKASATKLKGSINLQKAVLQNESIIHSNGAVETEAPDNTTVTEKVVVVLPTNGEDGPVDDEGQNEFELDGNKGKSIGLEAPLSSEGIEKQGDDRSIQTNKNKSGGSKKKSTKAEKAVCSEKNELTESKSESKSTGNAGEKKISRGGKLPVVKSKENQKKDPSENPVCSGKIELTESKSKSTGDAGENKITKGKKRCLVKSKEHHTEDPAEKDVCSEQIELNESKSNSTRDAGEKKITKGKKRPLVKSKEHHTEDPAEKAISSEKIESTESKSTGDAGEKRITEGKKRPLVKSKANRKKDHVEEVANDGSNSKHDEKKTVSGNEEEETAVLTGRTKGRPSKKLKSSAVMEKENIPSSIKQQSISKEDAKSLKRPLKNAAKAVVASPVKAIQKPKVRTEPARFILTGHKLQRKEFQQVIKRLKGRICRDSHHWSYQATHSIVPDPIRRTEKFFAAAASGSWILKTDYLTACNEAGKFLPEEPYEWHEEGLTGDGAINLEAPRKWRLLKERTGHGAFYGMKIVIYGECIAPPLDTLKRAVKAGDGTILATSPPYTRFLQSRIDFAIVSPGMPRVDMWVQEFLRHEVPCIAADYLVEYVCKPDYPLAKHVHYNTEAWAEKSLKNLMSRMEEVVIEEDVSTPEAYSGDDVACQVCGSRDRGEEMLICGSEHGTVGCGVGVHLDCLDPPLVDVPKDDWFCRSCSKKIKKSKTIGSSSSKRTSKSKK
ncbi:hypothetical protein ABFS83_04G008200 [Erythranthe nasuta]